MNKNQMLVQCHFVSGNTYTVGYVDAEAQVRLGTEVTLLDCGEPDHWWRVIWVGEPRPRSWLKRRWKNDI